MIIAQAIKMKNGCAYSNNLLEIDQIYLTNTTNGWYKKENIYDYLISNPKSIVVGTIYGPYVVPAISKNNEKFVKSVPNHTTLDNLLSLQRK